MKANQLTFVTLLLIFFLTSNLEAQLGAIDSLKIIPTNPTTSDSVKVISYTIFLSGDCQLTSSSVNISGAAIDIYATHTLGPYASICHSTDIITIGKLNAGTYELHYHLIANSLPTTNYTDTIIFTVQQATGFQQIELSKGFSFVSSRFIPYYPDMEEVVQEILNDDLQFVRNSVGAMLRKIGPNWVNGIGDWIGVEGYLIKTNFNGQFTIEGTLIPEDTPIELMAGFQFVSYLPDNEMDALEAFSSIIGDNLLYVRNSEGNMLRKIGPNWVNGIGLCYPGEGYLVKLLNNDVLIYPITYGEPCPGFPTVTYEGQVYNTVLIGDQCWFKENLNVGTMINGSEDMTDNGVIEKYCYDNDTANCETYGGLYQWNEMMEYSTTAGVQGICPEGWHLPTDDEWKILEGTVDSHYPVGDPIWNNTTWRGSDAGLNLKSTTAWYHGGNGTGLFYYEALPGGNCHSNGFFYNLTSNTDFWSSCEDNSSNAWYRGLSYYNGGVCRNYSSKDRGFSVRCLKN